jgi:microcystin degradation protein MlrC
MSAQSPRRILLAECLHEVCSFNPVPTRYEDFFVNTGPRMLDYHRGTGSEISGALNVFGERPDLTLIPTFSARGITSGGTIPAADFRRLADEFLHEVRQAGPVDAAYFALHGAMAAENEDDPEGYLMAEARKILGERIPLVASFDLHGILTDRMLQHTDAMTVYHTYPHVDFFETGQRAARLLLRLLAGEIRPVTAKVEIPALVRGDELITASGVFGQFIREAQQIEQSLGGLSAGMFIGNPFTDVPELRCYSVVTTDNDPARAEREALRLAEAFWPERGRMQAKLTPLQESVQQAAQLLETGPRGTVALVDAADATSSGASGDSNAILRELVATGYGGRALVPIVDPPAVDAAFTAGVSGTVQTPLGGALDRRRFTPLPISATVRMLSDGRFRSESFNQEWRSGRTALLEAGNITLVVTSRPVHLFDRSLFYAHGQNPRDFDLVVVKSPHCQHHMYAEWCTRLINVDAPGSTSANLPTLGHTRSRRPIFPLDDGVEFKPRARLFTRAPA